MKKKSKKSPSLYRIEVHGNWAGSSGSWRPAISGTLNQTGEDDESASTFRSHEEASVILENVVLPILRHQQEQAGIDWARGDEDTRHFAPRFRIHSFHA